MPNSKRVEFKTSDGVTLRGDFFKAEGKNVPVAVLLGGFSLPKETIHNFAEMFQAAGISALAYDNRTFGSSDGEPRQQIDMHQQAEDFSDAVTAASKLPDVDPAKIVMWGIGHGASAAMIAGGIEPRVAAIVFHAPFPSGTWDKAGFPKDLLDRAWKDRAEKTAKGSSEPAYQKVWRDWEKDGDGDETKLMIKGVAAYHLSGMAKQASEAAGTPWDNKVTLQSFINVAGVEPQDHVYKIKHPTLYIVHEDDPFSASPEVHAKVFSRMGMNAQMKVVKPSPDGNFMNQLGEAGNQTIAWVKKVLRGGYPL